MIVPIGCAESSERSGRGVRAAALAGSGEPAGYYDGMRSQKGTFRALLALFFASVFLAGCSSADTAETAWGRGAASDPAVWLAAYGLDGLDGREIIDTLDRMPVAERPDGLLASVRADQVVLTHEDGGEVAVPLPADEFYVSVAPYTDTTHQCLYHSLTTCLGELRNADVRVTATDSDGTQVISTVEMRTFDNGFVGLWLPRGFDGTVTLEQDGRTATVPVATGDDDPTCLTTARLT